MDHGALIASLAGLLGGVVLGLAARLGRFCMMGAVEDAANGGDLGRIRMVALAASVAIGGTFLLVALGGLNPATSLYARVGWSPLSTVLGGLMFGYGMALVGTCGFGALARTGGGDLRSLVMVIVIGISAYIALNGPLSALRLWLAVVAHQPGESLAAVAERLFGLPQLLSGLLAAGALAIFALASRPPLPRRRIGWGVAVGS